MQSLLSNLCLDSTPNFLGFFNLSIAPTLLYYAYLPSVVAVMFFAIFVLVKDKKSLISKLIFFIATFFSLWVINIIFQWVAVPNPIIHFSWQMTAIFEVPIFLLSVYFIDVFLNQKDISFKKKILLSFLYVLPLVFIPTKLNIFSYDSLNCQGNLGLLWLYIYILEIFCIIWVGYIGQKAYKKNLNNNFLRKKVILVVSAMIFFLFFFAGSNIYGEIFRNYELNLVGPIGMVLFLIFMSYVTIKYKTFNAHLATGQVLVFSLWALVFSLFFINNITTIHYIVLVTFIILIIVGILLIKSISREVKQKEELQTLSLNLEKSNFELGDANEKLKGLDKLKTEFLSLASHQLRSPLTAIKGYASMLTEGDFGKLDDKQSEAVNRIYASAQGLVNVVEDLLNVSKIEQGGMKYEFMPVDLGKLVLQLSDEMKITAQNKHLDFKTTIPENDVLMINADPTKIKQVFLNLVDNSIKYTQTGFVNIDLHRADDNQSVIFQVRDSGVGISPETKAKLFEKFSRGEGGKLNTGGSGLGLYLAKEIAKAHKGDIVIDSEGLGKGSVFTVMLPLSLSSQSKA